MIQNTSLSQWQLAGIFLYAGLLLNRNGSEFGGVLAGCDEMTVATVFTLSALGVFIMAACMAWGYLLKIRAENRRIHQAMVAQAAATLTG